MKIAQKFRNWKKIDAPKLKLAMSDVSHSDIANDI